MHIFLCTPTLSLLGRSLLLVLAAFVPFKLRALPFEISYMGRLTESNGMPISGPIDLEINFYRSEAGNDRIPLPALRYNSLPLSDGVFQVNISMSPLEFHQVFADSNSSVFVEVTDATHGRTYRRQKYNTVPYALKVPVDGSTIGYNADGKLIVRGLQGSALPAAAPSDGQILKWRDGSGWEWGADQTGSTPGAITSANIQDGTIANDDVATNAAIAGSKITPNFGAQNITTTGMISGDGSGLSNLPAGPLGTSVESNEITDGTISNADISASAAIDVSKINGLSASLAAREPAISTGTAAQYFKGDKTWSTLDTSAVPENINLYFTNARARAALSAATPLSFNSSTGEFTITSASGVSAGTISAAEFLSFSAKQAAITAASTVNTGTLTTSLQKAVEIKPYGTNAGENGELRFLEQSGSGSNYLGFKAPDTLAADKIYVLPATDGSVGQFLSTDGAGNLTWGSVGGAAGGTVTSITAGTGLTGGTITGSGTINLANTAVTPGTYTRSLITVDAQGRLTAAANGSSIDLTSDVSGTLPLANGGTGATTAALARTALSAAAAGANSDITSISGLTTALSIAQGGSGATTAPLARTSLGAAASGANSDITSISGLTTALSIAQGGSGATTAPLARTALSAAASGANSDITSITGLTTALSLAQGGTGATTAPLARTALSAAASGANSDITSITGLTTALSLAQGGTGATTAGDARTALGLGGLAAISSATSSEITDGTIVNVDISGSAAIDQSKIANLTSDLSTLTAGLSGREAAITAGTTAQYWRGDKSWQTLDSSIVAENSNLYFTDARSRGAISATAPLSYNSGTGVFSMPSATSVANGYLSSGDWLTFNNKQAAISAASTVNTGTLTTALQNGLSLKPFGTNAGETGEIRFNELEANGSESVGFKAPGAITATRIWTLPAADGSAGQVLSTNGTGTLTWISPGGGGTVTSITAGTGLSGGAITGSGTIDLANTAVSAGSYTRANITVDAQGRLTAASSNATIDLASEVSGALAVNNGGTGATTAALARSALGLGALATASSIDLTSAVTGALPLDKGGTGATTAVLARSALGLASLATASAVGSGEITDASIVNADIAAAAAIVDTKLATISTAGKVANSATTASSANSASSIVARDASGNFAAFGAELQTLDISSSLTIDTFGSFESPSIADNMSPGFKVLFISADGKVGIGSPGPLDKLQVQGDIRVGTSGSNGCVKGFGGTFFAGTCSSDERFKKDIAPLPRVLDRLSLLEPSHYRWRIEEFPHKHFGPQLELGLIAQQVLNSMPELIETDSDGYYQIRYQDLQFYILAGLRELKEQHESEIAALQAAQVKDRNEIKALRLLLCEKFPEAALCATTEP